jgi:putative membrane protein
LVIEPERARFNPLVRPYLVVSVGATMVATLIGIPFAILWFLGVGQWWARHYYDKLECELSETALRFRKGILFQVEKTIPLENIQDVTFIEGPVLRRFDLSVLKFETAGQSQGQAHAMRLIGIIDAHRFRSRILERREALKERLSGRNEGVTAADDLLSAVRVLDERLQEIASLLRTDRG